MPFPEKLPKRVVDAGTLIAEMTFGSRAETTVEYFIFVVLGNDGQFWTFYGNLDTKTGVFEGEDHAHDWNSLENALTNVSSIIAMVWQKARARVVACKIQTDTVEAIAFNRLYRSKHPELKGTVVRVITERRRETAPEPAPPRTILSRNDWMAIHYPNRVKS